MPRGDSSPINPMPNGNKIKMKSPKKNRYGFLLKCIKLAKYMPMAEIDIIFFITYMISWLCAQFSNVNLKDKIYVISTFVPD